MESKTMMAKLRKIQALLAAVACVALLPGCGGETKMDGAPSGDPAATGRYAEQECPLPDDITQILYMDVLPDQTAEIFAQTEDTAFALYTSPDGGRSWAVKDTPWMEAVKGGTIFSFMRDPRGGYAFAYATQEQVAAAEGRNSASGISLMRVDASGQASSQAVSDEGTYLTTLAQIDANGNLLTCSGFDEIQIYSLDTLALKSTISIASDSPISGFVLRGDTLFVATGKQIQLYSLSTGGQGDSYTASGGFYENQGSFYSSDAVLRSPISVNEDGTVISFCDRTGIYRQVVGSPLLEQVAVGDLLSLSIPTLQVGGFAAKEDGSFLVLYHPFSDPILMDYRFDPALALNPETTLSVYSLADNRTIRQTIGSFQRSNPSVRVAYTVGGDAGGDPPVSDLLRSLNTELLAGKGPDVLVLDQLPFESYIQKGVLRDLSASATQKVSGGEWLDKAQAFRTGDGKLFAIPARFAVPLMLAPQDSGVRDIAGLVQWIERISAENAGDYPKLFSPRTPKSLLRRYYPLGAPAWMESGAVKEDVLAEFLAHIKKLSDISIKPEDKDEADDYEPNSFSGFGLDALLWYSGQVPSIIEPVMEIDGLISAVGMADEKGGALSPAPVMAGASVYIPSCLLGVNAANSQQDLAVAFVETALSASVQSAGTKDGFPVNAASFAALLQEPGAAGTHHPSWQIGGGEEADFYQASWPPEETLQPVLDMLAGTSTASLADETALRILQEETAPFFAGNRTAQEAAAAVNAKMKLRLSE